MPSSATNNFDFIAPVYDALAQLVYGQAQKEAQLYFLQVISKGAHVLILGGGTGWILPKLLEQAQPGKVLFLEASAEMLKKARTHFYTSKAFPSYSQVEFRHGTEASLRTDEKFDVLLTPFVLDLFTPAQMLSVMHRLNEALLPNGYWLHTDFHIVKDGLCRLWQKPMLWGMYRLFRTVSGISGSTLPPFDAVFQQLQYTIKQEAFFYGQFIRAQVLQKSNSTS